MTLPLILKRKKRTNPKMTTSEDETSTEHARSLKREQRRKQCTARKAIEKEMNDRAEDETSVQRAKRIARDKNIPSMGS
jgi:hypothetical protein